jgi:hypothetical protein
MFGADNAVKMSCGQCYGSGVNAYTYIQGVQIGQIIAYWVFVCLGQFLKVTEVAQIFVPLLSTVKVIY